MLRMTQSGPQRCPLPLPRRMSERITACQTTFPDLSIKLIIIAASLIIAMSPAVSGLRLDSVSVPYHHVSGKRVRLQCPFVLEGEELYSVKWYRGTHEFFRYVPADAPNMMQNFDLPGVKVDTTASDQRVVELLPVTLESSGTFKCEVSADNPSFYTISKSATMLVVVLPNTPPRITGLKDHYRRGDYVNATCASVRSRPAAALTWYINEKQSPRQYLRQFAPRLEEGGLESALLGLHFRVSARQIEDHRIQLTCTASIAAVYWKNTTLSVAVEQPRSGRESAMESKGVIEGSSTATSAASTLSVALIGGATALLTGSGRSLLGLFS